MKTIAVVIFAICCVTVQSWTCPPHENGVPTFFPHEVNCWQYYECSNGVPILMECPGDLYWNEQLKGCSWGVKCEHLSTRRPAVTEKYSNL